MIEITDGQRHPQECIPVFIMYIMATDGQRRGTISM